MSEVEFLKGILLNLSEKDIDDTIKKSNANKSFKFRYCLHENEHSKLQEMFVVFNKRTPVKPHKHLKSAETNILLRGKARYIIFDDDGKEISSTIASADEHSVVRMEKNYYHLTIPLTDEIVVYEIKSGTFEDNKMIIPDWWEDCVERYF